MISIGTGKKLIIQGKVDKLTSKHFTVINPHLGLFGCSKFWPCIQNWSYNHSTFCLDVQYVASIKYVRTEGEGEVMEKGVEATAYATYACAFYSLLPAGRSCLHPPLTSSSRNLQAQACLNTHNLVLPSLHSFRDNGQASAKFSRFWTPSLPLVSTKFTQPWSEFSQPPPSPSGQTSYVHAPLLGRVSIKMRLHLQQANSALSWGLVRFEASASWGVWQIGSVNAFRGSLQIVQTCTGGW